jgi:homocitrate synthase NifV
MGPDEIEAIQAVAELRLQFHGHDDFGMATANTLAAVEGGAGAVSVTVNGLGESGPGTHRWKR